MSEVENSAVHTLTVGDRLQQARQTMHMDVVDVANQLHITVTYVNFIEKNQFHKLPGAIFTRGYIKSYARLVNLSVDEIVACYLEQESGSTVESSARPVAVNEYGVSMRRHAIKWSIAIVAVILFLPTLAWWYTHQDELDAVTTISAAEPLPSVVENPDTVVSSVDASIPIVNAGQITSPTPITDLTQNASLTSESDTDKSLLVVTQAPASNVDSAPSDTTLSSDALVVTFAEKCWIQVKNIEGVTLHDAEHQAGEQITIGGKSPFYVWVKNGKAVTVLFNGKPIKVDNIDSKGAARLVIGK